jgi:DNA-nicking Smr family endonuclease
MRRLGNDERELWARVVATVKPLRRVPGLHEDLVQKPRPGLQARPHMPTEHRKAASAPDSANGLDASWDRKLARGLASPDVTIDLHGHNLATAYATLDERLEQAAATGARLVLLITGKPPRGDRFPVERGAIRASVDSWLHASRHASDIAAVRSAHPRHGGAGALYLVLRRRRSRN